jgi:hypothetical protein
MAFNYLSGFAFFNICNNEIIKLSMKESARWRKAIQPVIYDYAKGAESKGQPGKEYIATIGELIKKYKNISDERKR